MTTDTPASDARPVRVPNVSAHAKSGLDHEVIGANAAEAYDANVALAADTDHDDRGIEVPSGDLDSRIAWVADDDDQDTRSERADAVYAHEVDADPDTDVADLSARLRSAVYGDPTPVSASPEPGDPTNGALPTGTTAVTDPTGIAGTHGTHIAGESVNALTGVVTPPGGVLPDAEQTGGNPLLPAVPEDLTTRDALLAWVNEGGDYRHERAQAVLNAEQEKPADDQRVTLVTPLTAILSESQTTAGTATVATTGQGEAVNLGSTE